MNSTDDDRRDDARTHASASKQVTVVSSAVCAAMAVAVIVLAAMTLAPLWAPLAFALWTATLLDPLACACAKRLGGRASLGAGIATTLVAALIVPVGLALTSIGSSVAAFVRQVLASPAARSALESIVSAEGGAAHATPSASELFRASLARIPELARTHGETAWRAASGFAGAGAIVVLTLFVFFVALYSFLSDGRAMWAWAKRHAPVSDAIAERLAKAFIETGRGLIVGAGLTALTQSLLATLIYAVMGVPRFAVLGALTFVCAFVPAVGTAVVWGPVAVGLFLKGQVVKAIVLALLGGLGISSIDNVVRPLMQRWGGNLQLPAFVLLLAAFGGLAAFGAKGLVLGPLSLRLAQEILAIAREAREANEPTNDEPRPDA
ncbi:MAG: AI-2E family transporter [Myxococcales bacterium]|nr:AI-2E family transporter [Myxococcales bacterium]